MNTSKLFIFGLAVIVMMVTAEGAAIKEALKNVPIPALDPCRRHKTEKQYNQTPRTEGQLQLQCIECLGRMWGVFECGWNALNGHCETLKPGVAPKKTTVVPARGTRTFGCPDFFATDPTNFRTMEQQSVDQIRQPDTAETLKDKACAGSDVMLQKNVATILLLNDPQYHLMPQLEFLKIAASAGDIIGVLTSSGIDLWSILINIVSATDHFFQEQTVIKKLALPNPEIFMMKQAAIGLLKVCWDPDYTQTINVDDAFAGRFSYPVSCNPCGRYPQFQKSLRRLPEDEFNVFIQKIENISPGAKAFWVTKAIANFLENPVEFENNLSKVVAAQKLKEQEKATKKGTGVPAEAPAPITGQKNKLRY